MADENNQSQSQSVANAVGAVTEPKVLISSNKLYDRLKWAVMIGLPAFSTLYFAVSGIWDLPSGEKVIGTISAITAFLGVVLGISNATYKSGQGEQGTIIVDSSGPETELYSLQLNGAVEQLTDGDTVTFKVVKSH